ncbi:hypothetical protein AAIM60_02325 [Pseudomonas lijiangensis]|uniref:hypothetical protein n=1 Tax=Pseudomonas lijiangensis TaxID=2995658 RepID=UPI0031B9B3A9
MADLDKRISGYFEAVSGRQNGVALQGGFGFSGEKFIADDQRQRHPQAQNIL